VLSKRLSDERFRAMSNALHVQTRSRKFHLYRNVVVLGFIVSLIIWLIFGFADIFYTSKYPSPEGYLLVPLLALWNMPVYLAVIIWWAAWRKYTGTMISTELEKWALAGGFIAVTIPLLHVLTVAFNPSMHGPGVHPGFTINVVSPMPFAVILSPLLVASGCAIGSWLMIKTRHKISDPVRLLVLVLCIWGIWWIINVSFLLVGNLTLFGLGLIALAVIARKLKKMSSRSVEA
jgi:hypothetical protein